MGPLGTRQLHHLAQGEGWRLVLDGRGYLRTRTMVELFSGHGNVSWEFERRGWRAVRVDIEDRFNTLFDRTEIASVAEWQPPRGLGRIDFLWASPPCTEFSRHGLKCFYKNPPEPRLDLVRATWSLIRRLRPTYWMIENVRAAQGWLGPARQHAGAFYLWGDFPKMPSLPRCVKGMTYHLNPDGSRSRCKSTNGKMTWRADLRAKIPPELARAVADTIELAIGEGVKCLA